MYLFQISSKYLGNRTVSMKCSLDFLDIDESSSEDDHYSYSYDTNEKVYQQQVMKEAKSV